MNTPALMSPECIAHPVSSSCTRNPTQYPYPENENHTQTLVARIVTPTGSDRDFALIQTTDAFV